MVSSLDVKWMNLAINLSRKNVGVTCGNPSVGCVLVKNGEIIATGVTAPNGRPHAEDIAIAKVNQGANQKTLGATLYVSLEPCSHFGKTPPCVDLIIKSGIKRVVIAAIDPDKRVNGNGVAKLKQAGIEVEVGVLEDEAREVNESFFFAKKMGRPLITLKLATSKDGKIADKNFNSKWITNEKSRQFVHLLRARNDGVLIGGNSLRKDNPELTCRILGLENYSPKRIILSNSLNLDLGSKVFKSADKIPTFIATSNFDFAKFSNQEIEIIQFDKLEDLFFKLPILGINSVLVEGGSVVAAELLKNGLVDRFIWMKAHKIIGEDGIDAIAGIGLDEVAKFGLKQVETGFFDPDIFTVYLSDQLCSQRFARK